MANPNTAFEAITTRQSWYAKEAVAQYDAVEIGEGGKYQKANGSGIFAGICEYGCEAEDRMITVVKGTFPVVVSEDVTAGNKLVVDDANPGQMKVGTANICGIALNDASEGELTALSMVESVVPGE